MPPTEFDFEKANSKFDKDKLKEEVLLRQQQSDGKDGEGVIVLPQGQGDEPAVVLPLPNTKSYDKTSSFFDTLSCETLDRMRQDQEGGGAGPNRRRSAADRKINVETFGQLSLNDRHRSHRGRRPPTHSHPHPHSSPTTSNGTHANANPAQTSGSASASGSRDRARNNNYPSASGAAPRSQQKRIFMPVQGVESSKGTKPGNLQ